jgi:hypothetical protein
LSRNIGTGDYAKNTLNHEYGHTIQLKLLGVTKYTVFIGIPSALSGGLEELDYYSMPWERSADLFGGVKRTTVYLPYIDAISYLYLANVKLSPYPDYFYGGSIHLP